MRFRVAAVPASYVSYDRFIVEDQDGRSYLFEAGRLTMLAPEERTLSLTVFEPSQSYDWHTEDELQRLLETLHHSRRYRPSPRSRSRTASSAAA